MPKKFGINSKSEEARARKAQVKKDENEKKEKAKEDAKWEETDKKILAKENRRKEQEEKKQQQLQRKQESKQLAEKEAQELAKKYTKPQARPTQFELQKKREAEARQKLQLEQQKKKEETEVPLEENLNRKLAQEEADPDTISARSVNEAVEKLSLSSGSFDLHPEKRLKAAFNAYEEKNMPILREDNPGLKLSQLKELLWKQWQKSPENPLNQ